MDRNQAQYERVRVGISACLVGHHVRYDGRQKREAGLADILSQVVDLDPVCPEVEIGMSVPREPIELTRTADGIRLLGVHSARDHTDDMRAFAQRRLDELTGDSTDNSTGNSTGHSTDRRGICGYIFKSGSPSCGLVDVPILDGHGQAPTDARGNAQEPGRGLFARALTDRLPHLPVAEEKPLRESGSLAHFVDRVRAHSRLRTLFARPLTAAALVAFHSREKLLLMAHDQATYRFLGPLVADAGRACRQPDSRAQLAAVYRQRFSRALARPASRGAHVNVMQHIAGYFKKHLSTRARTDLARAITDHGAGRKPLTGVLDSLRQYAHRFQIDYLQSQTYLDQHGCELLASARHSADES